MAVEKFVKIKPMTGSAGMPAQKKETKKDKPADQQSKKTSSKRKILLTDVVPDIEKYWDYEKNGGKKPSDFSKSASDKVYTFCPICGKSVPRNVRFSWEYDENGIGRVIHCRACGKRKKDNGLLELCPDIVQYWDYSRNEQKPEYYTINSGREVYINCPECGKSLHRPVCESVKKDSDGKYYTYPCRSCNVANTRQKKIRDNIIAECCPDIDKYWDEQNIYSPKELTLFSKEEIYTHCPSCGKCIPRFAYNSFSKVDGIWKVKKCQKCATNESIKKAAMSRNGPLRKECPEIEEWWDHQKNNISLDKITRGAHYEAFLQCPACLHSFQRDIHSFVRFNRKGVLLPRRCPKCGYSSKGNPEDNLTVVCPDIVRWWDYEKNAPFIPEQFTKGSSFPAYLTCPECGIELHTDIKAMLKTMNDGTVIIRHEGKCRKIKALKSDNNLVKCFPEIVDWWDYEKNYPDRPEAYTLFSPSEVHFKCPECGIGTFRRITDAFKMDESGVPLLFKCPYCNGTKPIPGVNSLAALYPDIAYECIDNDCEGIFPTASSRMEWECRSCHGRWFALVEERVKGEGCPYCDGRKVLPGYNDLKTTDPELAKEWSDNNTRGPESVKKDSKIMAIWKCPTCGGEYNCLVAERTVGDDNCPYCDGRKALPGYNDLKTTDPELAKEWSDNNTRGPESVKKDSSIMAIWKCPTCGGEYNCLVAERTVGDDNCPYCDGRKPLPGYNTFKVYHPDLMDEWLDIENIVIGIDPDSILDIDTNDVWWECKNCSEKYLMSVRERVMKKKRNQIPCSKCNGRRWKQMHFV